MRDAREARRKRIEDLLPRFPEAAEVLLRYRESLAGGEPPTAAPAGPETESPSPEADPSSPEADLSAAPPAIPARCPACGGPPGLAVIAEEPGTHGGARRLICARCEECWPFPRIVCPRCGEEERERLPRFRAEEIPHARIEACDACRAYLKAIDLTIDARAIPAVDDLATCALDLAARERGYRRVEEEGG